MSRLTKVLIIAFSVIFLAIIACDTSGTITQTTTEAELNEELTDKGFMVDLQPGKMLLFGEIEGMLIELEMTATASDGGVVIEITSVTVDGEPLPPDMFAALGMEVSKSIYNEDQDYQVDSVTITDNEIIITSSSK